MTAQPVQLDLFDPPAPLSAPTSAPVRRKGTTTRPRSAASRWRRACAANPCRFRPGAPLRVAVPATGTAATTTGPPATAAAPIRWRWWKPSRRPASHGAGAAGDGLARPAAPPWRGACSGIRPCRELGGDEWRYGNARIAGRAPGARYLA